MENIRVKNGKFENGKTFMEVYGVTHHKWKLMIKNNKIHCYHQGGYGWIYKYKNFPLEDGLLRLFGDEYMALRDAKFISDKYTAFLKQNKLDNTKDSIGEDGRLTLFLRCATHTTRGDAKYILVTDGRCMSSQTKEEKYIKNHPTNGFWMGDSTTEYNLTDATYVLVRRVGGAGNVLYTLPDVDPIEYGNLIERFPNEIQNELGSFGYSSKCNTYFEIKI